MDSEAVNKRHAPRSGRFHTHRLRRASFISPLTGERSKRAFTLYEASQHRNESANGHSEDENTPLLRRPNGNLTMMAVGTPSRTDALRNYCRQKATESWTFATSKTGIGILKCSLAYFLGSLATFVPAIAGIIGHQQDSKHMVATVTVWFHPARSIGSMHEATILGLIGLCFSAFISFASMGISMFFGHQNLLVVGHVIVLLIFLGGGLGAIAWVKQRLGHPLVNVACSLASLGCITILIKEGSVQAGEFSVGRVTQVLSMVVTGVITTTAVNLIVLPVFARTQLNQDMEKTTDLLGDILIAITRAFLSGRESDMHDKAFGTLNTAHQASLKSMAKDLSEAKRELYLLGRQRQYAIEERLVECLNGLSQDLGGLRSAAFAQFAFINNTLGDGNPVSSSPSEHHQVSNVLSVITEAPEESVLAGGSNGDTNPLTDRQDNISPLSVDTPEDMFFTFLTQLGPPTKSLVYTLKQILDDLPFRECSTLASRWSFLKGQALEVAINENFHSSLKQAIELYSQSRKDALSQLHETRASSAALAHSQGQKNHVNTGSQYNVTNESDSTAKPMQTQAVIADIEEVSAVCGHFSFSLLDFAEDVLTYLTLLDELKHEMANPKHSWTWLLPWAWGTSNDQSRSHLSKPGAFHEDHDEGHDIPLPIKRADDFADPKKSSLSRPWTYGLYKLVRRFQSDDVLFAIKVGLGAILYALPAFIPSSRPFFVRWRGEWGLVSYMAVCCMTIGASNTTGLNRILGTCIGALLAVVAWIIANDHGEANPALLGFFGWLVSLGCFYLIIGRSNGPMGRFILLTYNLGALYSYSLSMQDDDNEDDEGGIDPAIWYIVVHRLVAVLVGCIWGIFITRFIWPVSARQKFRDGLCVLWLRMGLVWKRDPLAMFLLGEPRSSYMDIREESSLQAFVSSLDELRKAATSEFELRGPFPNELTGRMIEHTGRMLDAFHAMNVVISKNLHYTPGEAAVLRYTRPERFELSARISHLFSVLASSVKLEYPINDVLPSIDHTRDRLLARISDFRSNGNDREITTEQDYELLYAYVLVTAQLSQEIEAVSADIETLFGTLNEDSLKLE